MSLSTRLKYRYQHWLNSLHSFRLPEWMVSKSTRTILSCLVIFFGLAYVVEINSLSTKGYEINTLEQKVLNLTNETGQLDAEVAANQSMASIVGRLSAEKMVLNTSVSYIRISAGTMVASR